MSYTPYGQGSGRDAPVDSGLRLDPLGWLAVLLASAILIVLLYAAGVRSRQSGHGEPVDSTQESQVLAE